MTTYSAIVKTENGVAIIKNQEYSTKNEFIKDLRKNGYKVNPKKVKKSDVFDYIFNHTNMYPWDWDITAVPAE